MSAVVQRLIDFGLSVAVVLIVRWIELKLWVHDLRRRVAVWRGRTA